MKYVLSLLLALPALALANTQATYVPHPQAAEHRNMQARSGFG